MKTKLAIMSIAFLIAQHHGQFHIGVKAGANIIKLKENLLKMNLNMTITSVGLRKFGLSDKTFSST